MVMINRYRLALRSQIFTAQLLDRGLCNYCTSDMFGTALTGIDPTGL